MNWYKKAQMNTTIKKAGFKSFIGYSTVALAMILGINLYDAYNIIQQKPQKANKIIREHYQEVNNAIENLPPEVIQQAEEITTEKRYNQPEIMEEYESFRVNDETTSQYPIEQSVVEPTITTSGIKQDLLDMIERHEGKRNRIYKDSLGVPTIGIGFNLNRVDAKQKLFNLGIDINKVFQGQKLTDEQVYSLFKDDVQTAKNDAMKFLPNFNEQPEIVQNILVDMAFNLGYNRLSNFKDFRQALISKNYNQASKEMKDSKWYHQVGNRSKELVHMMENI
jgi:lysozyme